MEADGLSEIYRKLVAPSSEKVTFATALNRKVTGSLNELVMSATFAFESGDTAPHQVGFDLNGFSRTGGKCSLWQRWVRRSGAAPVSRSLPRTSVQFSNGRLLVMITLSRS